MSAKFNSNRYLPRFVDRLIERKLGYIGAVEVDRNGAVKPSLHCSTHQVGR